ncbi:hypothetical protein CP556_15290 [Natrinema sp. CBA1119]|jgi:rubrerythrin|uniref:hypothetical protein n=1 Tax=unclassified Natrinema TaxID=2622230 RepID=UPI000BF85389|nr:hypothetical protein [Natrinema sp. CBA1119]PGF17325.1 hypothetical protein CP556_15290 [Natrinema sp. CBA1119]
MSLSTLLSQLFSGSETTTDTPETAAQSGDGVRSVTVVHECRDCGTNVSAGTTQCPTCESDAIVTHSID